ncbi:DnaJ subfamily C member 9 [Fasciola hepatica]|uniref:DnaJ subfamily C member 9 n=1 Tax=Fasciola hepatica TaxID=6192 RepID=A0A2H1BVH2_FASHE|nr:DnaJ subfamily C member 9 [Fasciola hepatica]
MVRLLSECELYFHCSNLYEVLGVSAECKQEECKLCFYPIKLFLPRDDTKVRKAFYKLSLKHHPDRQSEDVKENATIRFQVLSKVYSILADPEKRQVYDETGVIDDEGTLEDKTYDDWVKYWSLLFPRVTAKQIDQFFEKYRDSEEELDDVARVYEKCKGDMDVIMETVLCANYKDESRIRGMISKLIKDGKIQAYDAFTKENPEKAAKRAKREEREKKLFAREQKKNAAKGQEKSAENSTDNLSSLASAIVANRQRQTESLIDRLTEKYCKPPKALKKTTKRARK